MMTKTNITISLDTDLLQEFKNTVRFGTFSKEIEDLMKMRLSVVKKSSVKEVVNQKTIDEQEEDYLRIIADHNEMDNYDFYSKIYKEKGKLLTAQEFCQNDFKISIKEL